MSSLWYGHMHAYICAHPLSLRGLLSSSAREGSRMRLLVLSTFAWVLWVPVISVANCFYIWCMRVFCVCVARNISSSYYWLDLGTWRSSSLTSLRLWDPVCYVFLWSTLQLIFGMYSQCRLLLHCFIASVLKAWISTAFKRTFNLICFETCYILTALLFKRWT